MDAQSTFVYFLLTFNQFISLEKTKLTADILIRLLNKWQLTVPYGEKYEEYAPKTNRKQRFVLMQMLFLPLEVYSSLVFCFADRQKKRLGSVRFCIVPKVGGKSLKGISESDVICAVWATKSLICWWSVFQLERAAQAFPSAPKTFIPVFIVAYLLWLCSPSRRKYEKGKFDGMFSLRSRVDPHRHIKEPSRVVFSFQALFKKCLAHSL